MIINLNGIDEEVDEKFLEKLIIDVYGQPYKIVSYMIHKKGIEIIFKWNKRDNNDDRTFPYLLKKSVLEEYVRPVQRETHLNRLL